MSESVVINEVGLRDGLQNQPRAVSTADKLRLLHALLGAGVREFEVTSFVSPQAVPQMADAAQLWQALPQQGGVTYSALVPNLRGVERALGVGATTLACVLAATDTMNRRNIRRGLDEATTEALAMMRRVRDAGGQARAYIATAFVCPYEGAVAPDAVLALAAQLFDAGAQQVIVADTIGHAGPASVARLFDALASRHGAPALAGHFHDTHGLALANCRAAYEQGVRRFDASIGGLGGCPFAPGAAGNGATEDVVNLFHADGCDTGIDQEALPDAVAVAETCVGHALGGRWMSAWRARQASRRHATP